MENKYNILRIPFKILLTYDQKDDAIRKELIIDFNTNKLYVKSIDNSTFIEVGKVSMESAVKTEVNKILDDVEEDGNTLKKLRELTKTVEQWKNVMVSDDKTGTVSTLAKILNKFVDMSESSETVLVLINNKVDKIQDKGLSSNDFTRELFNKLLDIEDNANKYIHPTIKQCNYKAPVNLVNNKDNDVKITKEELGLENVDPNANNYVHPSTKQCNVEHILSINGKTENVTINTKSEVGLSNVENYGFDRYLSPKNAKVIISNMINSSITNKYTLTFIMPQENMSVHIDINGVIKVGIIFMDIPPGIYRYYVTNYNDDFYCVGNAIVIDKNIEIII